MSLRIPTLLQAQAQECGLACLAMVASALGRSTTLRELRGMGVAVDRGISVRQLVQQGAALGLRLRPVRLPLESLPAVKVPAILHWDLQHFVVLVSARRGQVRLIDPAQGERRLTMAEVSRHFTGVALEVERSASFSAKAPSESSLSRTWLWGQLQGQMPALMPLVALALLLELLLLMSPWIQQLIIDEVVIAGHTHVLAAVLAAGLALLTTQSALQALRSFWVRRLGLRLSEHCQDRLLAHALSLSPQYFARRSLGDTLSRFEALEVLHRVLIQGAPLVLIDFVLALLALGLMVAYAPLLALTVVATTLLVVGLRWSIDQRLQQATQQRVAAAARQHSHLLESLRAMPVLKLHGGEADRRLQWSSLLSDTLQHDARLESLRAHTAVAQQWVSGAEHLLILGLAAGVLMATDSSGATPFTLGMLLAFLAYRQQFTFRIHALADMLREWRLSRVHLDRLADLVQEPPEVPAVASSEALRGRPVPASNQPSSTPQPPASLELRDLGLRLSSGGPWLFRHLNLVIEPGSSVALAGPSGCGKSSLLDLLTGLRCPTEGDVLVDGRVVRPQDWPHIRAQMGVVRQDDTVLAGSVLEAIAPFDPEPDVARVAACAQQAQVHDDILALPGGYAAPVGECGATLSGGQRQRLLLARALYRQPRLLLMDEATSHLDVPTERAVAEALAKTPTTRFFIAHRPETLASAQRRLELVPEPGGQGAVLREA